MKITLKFCLLFMLAGFPIARVFAQQDILSASDDAVGTGGSVSWSVGLVAYSAWSEATGFITEGVQQPYEIFNLTGLEEFASNPEFIVFPNPTTGNVTLKFFDPNLKNISSRIYDVEGTLLRRVTVDSEEVSIPMEDLKPATYFLVILEKDQPVKTYKIIKR